jgi:hypothetical protein
MEHLSLHDREQGPSNAQSAGQSMAHPPPPQQGALQLPPQMFTTAAQLLDLTDSESPLFNMPSLYALTPFVNPNLSCDRVLAPTMPLSKTSQANNQPCAPPLSRKVTPSPSRRQETDRSPPKLGSIRCIPFLKMPRTDTDNTPLANLVLQDTVERLFVRDLYADIPRGVFLIRGENVLMLGEIVRALLKQPGPIFLAPST